MRSPADERADSYLDGALLPQEVIAFEHDLGTDPDVARALRGAIVLRQLLRDLPPAEPPPGLEERIVASLGAHSKSQTKAVRLPGARAALTGVSWLVRWPAVALGGQMEGARAATSGLARSRWMFGPLAAARSGTSRAKTVARTPIWKRALAFARA